MMKSNNLDCKTLLRGGFYLFLYDEGVEPVLFLKKRVKDAELENPHKFEILLIEYDVSRMSFRLLSKTLSDK